jgi:CRP-like cAMP-binding protein
MGSLLHESLSQNNRNLSQGGTEGGSREKKPASKIGIAKASAFDPATFLATSGLGKTIVNHQPGDTVFSQGDEANSIFYIQKGKIKIGALSARGKEATVAILSAGDFLGEDCIPVLIRLGCLLLKRCLNVFS